jgi:hypothetical protein
LAVDELALPFTISGAYARPQSLNGRRSRRRRARNHRTAHEPIAIDDRLPRQRNGASAAAGRAVENVLTKPGFSAVSV